MAPHFDGFDIHVVPVSGAVIHAHSAGDGPAVLLLHGFPQTSHMWHHLAPALAREFAVVAADLRGYGHSRAHSEDFTFRAMAADQVELMRHLGHERFHVVGHDRGARTAHRLAFDHPGAVLSVTLLDILPTLEVWRSMDAWLMHKYYHWAFLAQGGGLPQRLIGSDPAFFVRHTLQGISGTAVDFDPEALQAYEDAAQHPEVVDAWCRDYAAAAGPDREIDEADEHEQRDMPALVLWGSKGVVGVREDPLALWRRRFPRAVGTAVDAGHFLAEEKPAEVDTAVMDHLRASS
ncbi:fluoroacetate dehalogenase [Kocuria dechangensis]|uniref:Fluoroacetate dehalogenase n=1 Tax=Kocuria dechangensis TaxID=1176249 RepID=A0A917LUW6_9MICC|nr:alpha/beta hydrolase [Kocuria dechangensis]GGG58406.1 fluoroacetate dehalogenase [Kocuria dechangensis]